MNSIEVFGFDFDRIIEHCGKIKSIEDALHYLRQVLIEFEYVKRKYPDDFIRVYPSKDGPGYFYDAGGDPIIYVDFPDWVQNEIEYREAIYTLGKKGVNRKAKLVIPRKKQDKWMGDLNEPNELFKQLLKQLSLLGNKFIDENSARESQTYYENHFKNEEDLCGGKETKINWIATWTSYHYFYKLLPQKELFSFSEKGYSVFFEKHFLFKGQEKTRKQVADGCRGRDPDVNIQTKLNKILDYLF